MRRVNRAALFSLARAIERCCERRCARTTTVSSFPTSRGNVNEEEEEKKTLREDTERRQRSSTITTSTVVCYDVLFARNVRFYATFAAQNDDDDDEDDEDDTTDDETVTPARKKKKKTKKQLKDEHHFETVLVPGLERFYDKFKHLNVPKSYVDDEDEESVHFGRVVHNFRVRRERASLTSAQLERLDAVGAATGEKFVWDADEFVFEKQIVPGLMLFKKKFGHLNVPHKYCVDDGIDVDEDDRNSNQSENEDENALRKPYLKDFPLGAKVNDMRAKGTYILHQPQRLETLASLGFVWDDDQFRFEEMLVPAAVAYRQYSQRKLAETVLEKGGPPPRKLFGKHFKFRLPWTAVIAEREKTPKATKKNKTENEEITEEDFTVVPEFQSLLAARPYLDGFALGAVARRAHALARKKGEEKKKNKKKNKKNNTKRAEEDNQQSEDPKLVRAEKIVRKLRVLGVVFDDEAVVPSEEINNSK
jgi:hypothetical protein